MPKIPIESIVTDPTQPRKRFGGQADKELKASIKAQGLIQRPVVTPNGDGKFMIVVGERRYHACKELGWKELPVTIVTDVKHLEAKRLVENIQRKGLTAIEEAHGIKDLIAEHDYTQVDVAKLIGKSKVYVNERLALLNLPEQVQSLVLDGQLSFSHAKLLNQAPPENQEQLAEEVKSSSVQEAKKKIDAKKKPAKRKPVVTVKKDIEKALTLIENALKGLSAHPDLKHDNTTLKTRIKHLRTAQDSLVQFQGKEALA